MSPRSARSLLFVLACTGCASEPLPGTLINGMTEAPVGDVILIAKATDPAAEFRCKGFEATVGADGGFVFEDMCPELTYTLSLNKPGLWLAELDQIPGTPPDAPLVVPVWPAPEGSGLYKLSGGELSAIKTADDVRSDPVQGTEHLIRYPRHRGRRGTALAEGEHLLVVGSESIERLRFFPLIPSEARRFGPGGAVHMPPHEYVGVRFDSDTEYAEVEAELDRSKVLEKRKGERVVRWIPTEALATGRYAVLADDDKRMYILQIGEAPEAPEAPQPQPDGELSSP